ncbi:phosphate signaling complex PhoU family protein [Ktedonobacter racemifer]|uniref:Phosphate uptake regulator, PhoU n=1 Tax=Ktedonobacter racemifer DSM 44963 TaxID=485913 RepID=D6TMY6_KTERA|nr:PhoU domain-containing protein [Ktedonobacter racemifer]EFH87136.1 phosphate uptake regulator, PhoU [Ktedonobacter racemifer DSM 44963]
MSRSILDKELQELDAQIIRLGTMVDEALERALEALAAGDLAKAGMVIENDALIDSLRAAVEERAIRLLTLQQPLGGRDLRYLASVLSIAGDLERTGDGAAGIAQNILRMTPLRGDTMPHVKMETTGIKDAGSGNTITEASIMKGILDLGKEARRVLQGTIKAFKDRDVKAARYIWEEDDVVDVRYHMVRHDLMAMMGGAHAVPALLNDSLILQRATYLLWMAHKLERVGDHCANVCERLLFIVEGDSYVQNLPQQGKETKPQI